jgi:hypothetical protein
MDSNAIRLDNIGKNQKPTAQAKRQRVKAVHAAFQTHLVKTL